MQIDETLMSGARFKSNDMFDNNYYAHISPTYGDATDMLKNVFNYEFSGYYSGAGENIATGQITPFEVVEDWLNSNGHRENILNPNYKYIGVGLSGTIWTQIFVG